MSLTAVTGPRKYARMMLPAKQNPSCLSIFDRIRGQSAFVMAEAGDVHINEDRIENYTQEILDLYPAMPDMSDDWHLIDRQNPEAMYLYVLILDSINFGSGYFEAVRPYKGMSGYALVASCLKQAFQQKGWDQIAVLSSLTAEDCAAVFHQDITQLEIHHLMGLFVWSIQVTLRHLRQDYNGSAMSLLEKTGRSATGLVNAVSVWENFADVSVYKNQQIPFLKRAQILAADMHLAEGGGLFDDMDQVTIFADNQVPHVLHLDGLLSYSEDVCRKIETGYLFEHGESAEVEIRAAAICAVEKMAAVARKNGFADRTAFWFDQVLWHRGLEPDFASKRAHRSKTIFY